MARSNKKEKKKSLAETLGLNNIFNEKVIFIGGIVLFARAVWLLISFISYFSTGVDDQSLIEIPKAGEVMNAHHEFANICGSMGAYISYFFIKQCFGLASFLIPAFMLVASLKMMRAYNINLLKWFFCTMLVMIWASVTLAKFLTPLFIDAPFNPGGDHGVFVCQRIEDLMGTPGLTAVLAVTAIMFLTFISAETIYVIRKMLNPVKYFSSKVKFVISNNDEKTAEDDQHEETAADPTVFDNPDTQTVEFDVDGGVKKVEMKETPNSSTIDEPLPPLMTEPAAPAADAAVMAHAAVKGSPDLSIEVASTEEKATSKNLVNVGGEMIAAYDPKRDLENYHYPTLDLLKKYENDGKPFIDMEEQNANKNRIVEVLRNFGVEISSIKATVGPTITLYEITPAVGVRISKIRNLEDDIALSLSALGIRIIAPIPGKGTIGIEVPNANPKIVSMRSIINSKKFQETTYDLPVALGKTITNDVFMVDLTKAPHMLVAGATGQGKSVGLNAIVTSLLYKKHPAELKFVIIDPKKVEFSVYAPIERHFLAKLPDGDDAIITDVTKVVQTLNSLCSEMDTRYDLLRKAGCRNIKEYNAKFISRKLNPEKGHRFMPYIVIIIDEFGDLIMTAGKEIELPICRIAQLARAIGIHAIIATQRPTTNIITGTIKANFPARIAFRVAAMMDSRTILDRSGAQQLIGKGDMLYLQGNDPVRVQCAFVDTPEVENITNYISKQQGYTSAFMLPEYVGEESESTLGDIDMNRLDPMFEDAARLIVIHQQGSTSLIQRKFSIGYNRAGRIMDQLERAGIVGPTQGSKAREVLCVDETDLQMRLSNLQQ